MEPDRPETTQGQPSIAEAALSGLCPRCGGKTLFAGVVRFSPRCSACELDFGSFDVGDGPAAFLTLIVGTLVVALAIWLELSVGPQFWVHILLWVPLSAALTLGGLRLAKGALLASEYRNRACEAQTRRAP